MLPVRNIKLILGKFDVQQYFMIFPDLQLAIIIVQDLTHFFFIKYTLIGLINLTINP